MAEKNPNITGKGSDTKDFYLQFVHTCFECSLDFTSAGGIAAEKDRSRDLEAVYFEFG